MDPGAAAVRWSEEVCQAYAVNTKTFYASRVYKHTDAVVDLLAELGVRTVRERAATGDSPGARRQRAAMPRLVERGVRWHPTVAALRDWPRAESATYEVLQLFTDHYLPQLDGDLSALVHSFGGCNEVEGPVISGRVDPAWAEHARLMQTELWRQFKADERTQAIPIVGPSTRSDVSVDKAEALGDLSAVSDWGNAHLYGAGGSPSRGIDRQRDILRRCFPDATRWFFTETGYSNSPQTNAGRTVPEEAAATYAIRGICDFFVRGCVYGRFELLDDPDPIDYASQQTINATADRQAHFGLVAMPAESVAAATPDTWRKKPEFYATQRFLALMADPGSAWTPEQYGLQVSGGGQDLQQALVQKRDGRHYLLLWRDVQVSTLYPEARTIDVPPSSITVTLPTARPIAVYSPRDTAEPLRTAPPLTSIAVDVGADLVVVEIG
ncbi:hypothetical protein BH20ACT6_BH20ACT6_07290 [soil metagenome]